MSIKIINVQLNPELKKINLGRVNLSYTNHANERCKDKHINNKPHFAFIEGNVVELEQNTKTNKTTKIVIRTRYNYNYDLVLVLIPGNSLENRTLIVKTCWLNHVTDNHETLNKQRVA